MSERTSEQGGQKVKGIFFFEKKKKKGEVEIN